MKSKKIWFGLLVLVLVFGFLIIGCEQEIDQKEDNNKFFGTWVQALPVSDVSFLDSAVQSAGMGSASIENGGKFYVKDDNQWYEENSNLLWYYFKNSTYTFATGLTGTESSAISYSFTNSEITTGGGSKPYTFTTKQNNNMRVDILKWDGIILLKKTLIIL